MSRWSWQVLSDGWTQAHEAVVLRGGSWTEMVRFHATAVLLEHERHGRVPFDTGYSSRFFGETATWPYCLYRWVTPVFLNETGGIAEELRKRDVAPDSVDHVIISHWHADHIGGLLDFPGAALHTNRNAWESVAQCRGLAAVRKAFLPGLVPDDAPGRMQWLEEGSDLFGDGSLTVLELPGHATGQIGVRFTARDGQPVLLVADACWLSESVRANRMPHPVTRIIHDWEAYGRTLERLHRLSRSEPGLLIVPSHCPETAARINDVTRS